MNCKRTVLLLFVLSSANGCGGSSTQEIPKSSAKEELTHEIQQGQSCWVDSQVALKNREKCKPGQKIAYLPSSWGNAQLPVQFVADNCDMRYSIAMTNGGVACIFAPVDVDPVLDALLKSSPE